MNMRNRSLEHNGYATLEETLLAFSVEELKSLARLVAKHLPPRKAGLVQLLKREMTGAGIKRLWEELDETERLAVSESLHLPGRTSTFCSSCCPKGAVTNDRAL